MSVIIAEKYHTIFIINGTLNIFKDIS